MNTYDFVHMTIAAMGGEIRGRTKLQKTVYFLGVMTDSLKELGFRPHFYGPYSSEVADGIDQLKSLGFVDQNVATAGGFDAAGFEVARYDYKLNDQGKVVVEQKKRAHPDEWRKIEKAAVVLRKSNTEDYVKPSIAAKTYFMLGEKKENATKTELAQLATKFGWSVTKEQVEEAANYLKSLGLINLTPPG